MSRFHVNKLPVSARAPKMVLMISVSMLRKLSLGFIFFLAFTAPVKAQEVSAIGTPAIPDLVPLDPAVGGTVNQTVSTGSKASLSFGSSTSFGSSASLSGTSSTTTQVSSKVKLKDLDLSDVQGNNDACPTGNCISTRLGQSSLDGVQTSGTITADISNLRANNANLEGSPDNNYVNGRATLSGVTASNDLVLDGMASEFSVSTRTVHENSPDQRDPVTLTKDENQLSNGSASSVVNSQTTVDINTNQFVSTFQQAY